ncbi:MAG: D-alanine--D-alanine ligase [Gemmatimonadales bacterium]
MRIALAYNQRPDALQDGGDTDGDGASESLCVEAFVEWDEPATIQAVADALAALGEVIPLEATGDFPSRLHNSRPDLLFNMAEGLSGPSREAQVPAIAEFLGIPYTGSDPLTLALALHKARSKEIWQRHGIPTAPFVLIADRDDVEQLRRFQHYPAFLKPAWEGSSKGITQANLVEHPARAIEQCVHLLDRYQQPILAESFLPGDEFTVAVLGNGDRTTCLPLIRYRFDGLPAGAVPVVGFEAKWTWDQPHDPLEILECPAAIAPALEAVLRDTALRAYRCLGCRDWGRVDLRLDPAGVPSVIEINPLPGVIPDPVANSCFPRAAHEAGMTHAELIQHVASIAWQRITGTPLSVPTLAGAAS